MARRHWTLMIVPDDHAGVKQYRLSRRLVRLGGGTALLVFVVMSTLAAGFFVREDQRLDAERLARTNALLVEELEGIQAEMETLEESLAQLSEKDERYRLLANLEPLDEDVKLAGVGGPGSRTVEDSHLWQVAPEAGSRAFSARGGIESLVRRARVLSSSWDEATEAMEEQVDIWERTPSILPTNGYKSSNYSLSRMHPILNVRRPHKGIDIVARRGTPVVAAAKGTVRYAGDTGGDYGVIVDIDHGNGVMTRYAHLAKGSVVVRRGQSVERWQKVAEVGSTGLVTSPSVHYEVLQNGRAVNPDKFVLSDVLQF